MGRPKGSGLTYTSEIAAEICYRLSLGETLTHICTTPGMPAPPTVCAWAGPDGVPGFAELYARARDRGIDAQVDEMMEVARDQKLDSNHKRVLVDAIKWRAGKMAPKRYGDRVAHEVSGPDGGAVQTSITVKFVEPPATPDA